MANVTIIGAGAFGTALAIYNHRQGHQVCVWAFEKDLPESVRAEGENKQYLADVKVPAGVAWTNDMGEACKGADLVMIVVPSAHVRMTARALKDHLPSDAPIVSTAKGVETETLALMSDVLRQELPHHRSDLCYMSGPSFAREVAMGRPADVALAGADNAKARQAQEILHSASFRVYTSVDIIGVELGGALKNVVAVACGASDGLNMGASARASLMTRGLAEITRMGVTMGANPLTFLGLAGVGDLILTCTGDLSRNRTLGMRIAKGEKASDIVAGQAAVAEGYASAPAVNALAEKMDVDMPISRAVYRVLYEDANLVTEAAHLMSRESKDELMGILDVK